MVIAPHADDAELAAYGLYSQAQEAWVVTLTAGEIEAEHYRQMGLGKAEAARLKGRLRAWDSIAVPRWAGWRNLVVCSWATSACNCLAMQAPDRPAASREADMADIRPFRQFNPFPLPADLDGAPTWHNLLADLRAVLELARPGWCCRTPAGPAPRSCLRPGRGARSLAGWPGSHRPCCATPTTCMTTIAGQWAIAVTAWRCRRS